MLSDLQIDRYSRQIILPGVGGRGQERLLASSLAVVDAGGDAEVLLLYLAAAGIGHVTVHNPLERSDWDQHVREARELNPDCQIEVSSKWSLDADAAQAVLLSEGASPWGAPINVDCARAGKPLIWSRSRGAVGSLGVATSETPTGCYECAESPLDLDAVATRPPAAAILASIQAGEATSYLLGTGSSVGGSILRIDAAAGVFSTFEAKRSDGCAACALREAR